MTLNTIKRKRFTSVLFFSLVLFSSTIKAQENDIVEFLQAEKEDASMLMQGYLNPVIEGLSYGLNGGWAQTAKAHKTLGFDLMINVNAVFIPSSKNYFDPRKFLDPNTTSFSSESPNGLAPTLVGPKDGSEYVISRDLDGDGDNENVTIKGPEGLDFKKNLKVSGVLTPTATLGIGIYKNTDLKIRWMPEVDASDSKVKLFGLGIMHDIKQHIPGIKLLPFDLSVMAAFTKINGETDLSGELDSPPGGGRQFVDYEMNAWLIQAMISKKISVLTVYGGVGYNTVKTTASVKGSYIITDDSGFASVEINDPLSMSFKNKGLRATAGFRLKLAVLCLSADYTLQEYNTLSVGIGVAVR